MVLKFSLTVAVVGFLSLASPTRGAAQSCSGPGAVYGVTSYECEKCGMSMKDGRPQFVFNTEPKVLEVEAGSVLRAGDVIVSVGTHRITTAEGARLFTYPPPRSVVRLEVRREGRTVVTVGEVKIDCHSPQRGATGTPPLYTVETGVGEVEAGKVGFALACRPSCTRTKGPNGVDYWKFDAPPPVIAVRPGSVAERMGMQVGDVVIAVDGKPLMTPEANYRLFTFPSEGGKIQLTFERNGKRLTYSLHGK